METQKATINEKYTDARVGEWRDRAEHYKSVVAIVDGELRTVIKSVIKYPRDGAGRLQCLVWLMRIGRHGTGRAGGYGYHKASAAIREALKAAGITLENDIHGHGDTAVNDALIAVASAMLGKPLTNRVDVLIVE